MSRYVLAVLPLILVLAAGARAGEVSGNYQSIDLGQSTVTIRVNGKDVTYKVDRNARFYDDAERELKGGLSTAKEIFKEGQKVTFSTELKEGVEWVLQVKTKK
jgi:hypothetical protein